MIVNIIIYAEHISGNLSEFKPLSSVANNSASIVKGGGPQVTSEPPRSSDAILPKTVAQQNIEEKVKNKSIGMFLLR